jgi:Holliday junction resolvase RusA-like endonuclease
MLEYESKYYDIPRDLEGRINYLYDKLNIDDTKSEEILAYRDAYIQSTYYKTINITMYEIPEHTPRPRARIISKKGIINAATGNNSFIQVYSLTGRDNKQYMERFTKDNLQELEYLLCVPCNLELRTYFPTPKYYNKTQMFMAEIGLDRPINKPDFDNIEKSYGDMFTDNIWVDDIVVVDATIRKFYSILPRVEIILQYQNHLYNKHQHDAMLKRKNYTEGMNIDYFGG